MNDREFSIRVGIGRALAYLAGVAVALVVICALLGANTAALIATAVAVALVFVYAQTSVYLITTVTDEEQTKINRRLDRMERR